MCRLVVLRHFNQISIGISEIHGCHRSERPGATHRPFNHSYVVLFEISLLIKLYINSREFPSFTYGSNRFALFVICNFPFKILPKVSVNSSFVLQAKAKSNPSFSKFSQGTVNKGTLARNISKQLVLDKQMATLDLNN